MPLLGKEDFIDDKLIWEKVDKSVRAFFLKGLQH